MKRFYKFLTPVLLMIALAVPLGSRAQVTLTVADGTTTNNYVPVYGFYADAYLRAEFVYPSSMLSAMGGSVINSVTFYASTSSVSWGSANFVVSVKEIASSTLTGFYSGNDMTQVYTGSLSIGSNGQMTVTFATPYLYGGGNLLFKIDNMVEGTYVTSTWYGISSTGSSYQGYDYDDYSDITATSRDFLPKATFNYTPGAGFCPAPGNFTVRNFTSTSAVLEWNIPEIFDNVNSVYVEYGEQGFTPGSGVSATVDGDSAVISNLTPGTYYQACAYSSCGTDGYSDTVWVSFFTPAEPVAFLPYSTGFELGEDLSWAINNNNGPNKWYIDTAAKFSGDYGLYISADSGRTNTYVHTTSYSYAGRNFVLDSGMYALGFDWRCMGESSTYDNMKVYLAPGNTDMTASSINISGWSLIGTFNGSSEWQSNGVQFTVPSDGEWFIVFRWYNDNSGGDNPPAAIDNVTLRELTCVTPTGLTVTNTGITSASLAWHPGAGEEAWAISVNGSEWHEVLDTILVIDTLRDNTQYTFRLKAVCGSDDSSFVTSTSTTTQRYCYAVTNIAASNIGFTSAGFSWTPSSNGNPATAVTVTLTCNDTTVTTVPAPQTVTGTSVLFSGLQPATSYTATFATVCGEHDADTNNRPTLTFSTSSCGEITGTSNNSYVPFYTLYDYSYSQTLYDADIVAAIDSITGISYEIYGPQSGETATVDIYMGYTTLTSLSNNNYVPASDLTKVVSDAQVNVGQAGWVTIPFDTAFHPNGSGKLVVAVVNKTGDWFSSVSWSAKSVSAGSSVYWYRDGTIITPASPGGTNGTSAYVPNTRFEGNCDLTGCMASNVAVTGSTTGSIDVAWVANGSESNWIVGYRPLGGEWVYESTPVTTSPYTISGLNPSMGYEIVLGSLCQNGENTDTLWSTTTGYTECALGTLPYSNDFTATLGPCWNVRSTSVNSSHQLYLSGVNARAILPELPLQTVMIMMSVKGTANGGLQLGVTEDNGTTVEWLDTVVIASSSEFNTVSSTLRGYAGDATRMVLAPVAGTSTVYLDFINIDLNAGCTPVENLTVTNLHGNTATLLWSSEQTSFNVSWRVAGAQTWNDTVVTEDSIAFTTLTPQTNYEVRVRPDCSQSESFWMTATFTTPCAFVQTPFYENFSATTLSSCWTLANGLFGAETPSAYNGGWSRYTSYVFTDGHYKVNIYGTSCKYWLITPEIQLGEDMALGFDAAFTAYASASTPSSVGNDDRFVVAITTDGSTWTPLATWGNGSTTQLNSIPATGAHYSIDLSAYNNQIVSIAFYGESTESNADNDLHIDNISVMRGGCGAPTALTFDSADYNNATLHWSDTTSAMTAYDVIYGTVNDVNDTNNRTVTVSNTNVTLTGLHNGTRYYVWVRTVCDDFSSTWSNSVNFTTPRSCFSPNSYQIANVGFSTANFSWSYDDAQVATGLPITGTIVRVVNESDTSVADIIQTVTGTSIALSGLTPSTDYRIYLTTICDPDTTYAVSFALSTTGCAEESTGGVNFSTMPFMGNYNYGYSQAIYPVEILQYMDTIRGVSYKISSPASSYPTRPVSVYMGYTNRTSLDTNSFVPVDSLQLMVTDFPMAVNNSGWTTILFDTFFVNNGTSDIVVAVDNNTGNYSSITWSGHTANGNMGVWWYTDNFDIDPATPNATLSGTLYRGSSTFVPDIRFVGNCLLGSCLPPMLVIDSTSTTEAYASITPGGEDSLWIIQYRESGATAWNSTTASTLTSRTITGLQHSTLYEFRAGSICDNDTIWARAIDHYTECAPVNVPMVEHFNNGVSPCWMDTLVSLYISNDLDIYAYLSGRRSYLKTPVINASVDTLQVRVGMRASTAGEMLRVGVADEDGNNVEWLDSVAAQSTSTFNEEVLFIHNYSGTDLTNRRIVLAPAGSANYYYVTSVIVEPLMPCLPIRNLHVVDSATTASSITIDWTDLQSAGSWAVEYGQENFELGTGTVVNATAHPVVINGLTSSTAYHFYVTPVCTADSGITAGPIRAVTEYEPCANGVTVENFTSSQSTTTSSYSPIGYALYNYSYTQTLIDSAYLADLNGDIVSFAFNPTNTTSSDMYNGITIYMANVSDTTLANGFIKPDSALTFVEVLSNTSLNFTETGWNYVNLTTPFAWDGHSNVLFAVKRDNGSWGSSTSFSAHTTTGTAKKMRYVSTDSAPYNITTVSGGTAYAAVGDLRFISCGETSICNAPETLTVTDTAEDALSISWTGTADNYEVACVLGTWVEPTTPVTVSGTTHPFTGLLPDTVYTIGVRAVCSEESVSQWVFTTVRTLEHSCMIPTNVQVSNVTLNSAVIDWTPGEEETEWELNITGTNYDRTVAVTSENKPYTVTGLANNQTYVVKVRAICGQNNYSEWSDEKTFTTTTCQPVSNLGKSNITAHSATISWNAPSASVVNFEIEYGLRGFNQGSGTLVTVNGAVSYNLTGLLEETAYDVYVRSICAEGAYSTWSAISVTTLSEQQGIEDVDNASISLYPNPASSTVTLTGIAGMATVTVVDMNGRVSGEWTVNDGTLTIDVTSMAQGAYFVRIVGEQTNAIRKLIVR